MFAILPWLLAAAAHAACETPRSAAASLFVAGTPCVPVVDGRDPASDAGLLRAVLDARGLRIPAATLSDDPEWTDARGEPVFAPLPAEPWLALDRAPDGTWRYSPETIAQVPRMHEESFSGVSRWLQERIPAIPGRTILGLHPWQLAYMGLVVVAALAIGALVRDGLLRTVRRPGQHVPDAALRAVNAPLCIVSVFGLAAWTLTDLALPPGWARPATLGAHVALGIGAILLVSRLVSLGGHVARARATATTSRFDDQIVPVVQQGAQVLVWVLGSLLVLQLSGFEVWGVFAGLGIGSLAVALAAQDSLKNLFGALNIFLDRPFQVGDWVVIRDVEGTVEEVGFRSFRVRTFQDSVVTIPNSRITDTDVENMGARTRRRTKFNLSVRYDTSPDRLSAFIEGIRGLLRAEPLVDADLEVRIDALGESAIAVMLYFYVKAKTWPEELEVKDRVFLAVLRLSAEMRIEFAFPTRTLHVAPEPSDPR